MYKLCFEAVNGVSNRNKLVLFPQHEDTTEPSECSRCSRSKVELAEELEELHEEFEMLTFKSQAVNLSCVYGSMPFTLNFL